MKPRQFIEDLELKGRRVLVRVDFNVPLDEQQQITDDRRNDADYLLVTYKRSWPSFRLQLFQDFSKVQDNISDNLVQWLQQPNSAGELIPVTDPLPASCTCFKSS